MHIFSDIYSSQRINPDGFGDILHLSSSVYNISTIPLEIS